MQDDDLTLTRLLIRYWWPFWLFHDATRGDPFVRAAAYRHNREQRVYLPGYLLKWLFLCGLMLGMTNGFEILAVAMEELQQLFLALAACSGVSFALGFCILFKTAYVYVYLSSRER